MGVRAILHRHQYGYWAEVPSLPGCVAFGGTRDEALENIYERADEAVRAYRVGGRPVPWQPDTSEVPADGEVHDLHPFWDDPLPPIDWEAIDAERARGEGIPIEDILREYGVDVPPRRP